MILLDTDHVTLYHWGMVEGERIRNRLDLLGLGDRPATTVITYEEQVRGWMKELAAAKNVTDEVALYARLNNQSEIIWEVAGGGLYRKGGDGVSAIARVEGENWDNGFEDCGDCAGEQGDVVVPEFEGLSTSAGVAGGGCGGVG